MVDLLVAERGSDDKSFVHRLVELCSSDEDVAEHDENIHYFSCSVRDAQVGNHLVKQDAIVSGLDLLDAMSKRELRVMLRRVLLCAALHPAS